LAEVIKKRNKTKTDFEEEIVREIVREGSPEEGREPVMGKFFLKQMGCKPAVKEWGELWMIRMGNQQRKTMRQAQEEVGQRQRQLFMVALCNRADHYIFAL